MVAPLAPYVPAAALHAEWRALFADVGVEPIEVGRSVQGRPLLRYDVGAEGQPVVLLSALMHAIELIGSVALFDIVRALLADTELARALRSRARFVVMPIINPDGHHRVVGEIAAGQRASRRRNANGVDLNRNFPVVTDRRSWSPTSGSRFRWSPFYRGAHPLSEPESRALAEVARATRPQLAVAFHSPGNFILHPWAHTAAPHPRADTYRALGEAMRAAQPNRPYRLMAAHQMYPILGELDDWLDAELGTLAFTVEVGRFDRRLLDPRRGTNPFWWVNPTDVDGTVAKVTPGVMALLAKALL